MDMDTELKYKESYTRKVIYKFLVNYVVQHGYSPSIRDICEGTGISSTSSVHHQLAVLEDIGLIKMKQSTPRAIKIVGYEFVKSG